MYLLQAGRPFKGSPFSFGWEKRPEIKAGTCPKCSSVNQQYLELDERHGHYALRCFVCAHASEYRSANGTVEKPKPYVKESRQWHSIPQRRGIANLRNYDSSSGR